MKVAIVSVTKSGDEIAQRISTKLEIDLYSKEYIENFNLKETTKKLMKEYKAIIFISSTGIAVRAISEYIIGKDKDPAIIVIDSSGRFVISLLSGHLGGANELTMEVAEILNSTPVITTATDNLGVVAPDMLAKQNKLIIDNLKDAKHIAALLVDKKKVGFVDLKNQINLPKGYTKNFLEAEGLVYITHNLIDDISNRKFNLKLIRRDIVLGIGCRKNYNAEEMRLNVCNLLEKLNIDERAVKAIGTVEVKRYEQGILELRNHLGCELGIFSIGEIKAIQQKFKGSDFVEKTIGVRAVCEPCVELLGGKLITEKIKINGMTICIGEL
ncbi:cobalt-precorrin 5A hydrolase [Clostridium sp. DJ247]|uniref:cobalt-precorrin 5A hydrolase n=1 Tax=Clostridium sp. DJ247 TaxID=2726188 RepID=UPI00162995F4|nr:cobalt-precorrin 5A hydrolase [Clostridium sp. DJ247]MBC2582902.1 cobalt-precorrin 5A hydrolase [Clostridium sp. DJ247]